MPQMELLSDTWAYMVDNQDRVRDALIVHISLSLAALLLGGAEADWSIKKGALWWLSNRVRRGETQTVLRAALPTDLL